MPKTNSITDKRLTLRLDAETYRRLRLLSVEEGQTHQAMIERALMEYLARNEVAA